MLEKDILELLGTQWCRECAAKLLAECTEFIHRATRDEMRPAFPSVRRHVWNEVLLALFAQVNMPDEMREQSAEGTVSPPGIDAYETFARQKVAGAFYEVAEALHAWEPPETLLEEEFLP